MADTGPIEAFWSHSAEDVARELQAPPTGLSSAEASRRLQTIGPNSLSARTEATTLRLLARQFTNPIILLLLAAAVLSAFLGDAADATIIVVIIGISGLLGFWQERGAATAVRALLATVSVKVRVRRDGAVATVPIEEIVPGDVVELSAGATVPGDCLLLESRDLFVDESALTGETFPVEKQPQTSPADAPLSRRLGALFMGTHVVSGSATAVVVATGRSTEFGAISQRLRLRPAETEFEHGVRRFGSLLMEITFLLVLAIFAVNVILHRPPLDSFLFALALAVGLTPQLLPAIISINLAHGAREMARDQVIVKQLESLENLGSMNVLCADKTGTLTQGIVQLQSTLAADGSPSALVGFLALLNSSLETAFSNPIDEAIRATGGFELAGWKKLDEEPYDFVRKRLSILAEGPESTLRSRPELAPLIAEQVMAGNSGADVGVSDPAEHTRIMTTKGSVAAVLEVSTRCVMPDGSTCDIKERRADIDRLYGELSAQGLRTLGVAWRPDVTTDRIDSADERGMTFAGLIVLHDPAKPDAADAVRRLRELGVRLKIITGDNTAVAGTLGAAMDIAQPRVVTGSELTSLSSSAVLQLADSVDIFAEIEPNQKEYVVASLRKVGNVVGFMGDGINDAPALHAADVGISVDSAVDVAKEAAKIVLLAPGLDVLADGVRSGRRTFANTLKYAFMATSANFGNMFSMAGASLFLPFLPLLPTQILLTNLLTDIPETTIATDAVDPELVEKPRRWDLHFLRNFMLVFGPLSSVFDFATFGVLLLILHAGTNEFRTGWFTESVISASMVVLVIRTRRPFVRSRPSWQLATATAAVAVVTLALPYTPIGPLFKLVPLPPLFYAALLGILILYVISAEVVKVLFYRRYK